MNNLIEKKVAYAGGICGLVTLVLGLAATYHWFTPPPPYLTALGVSLLSGLVGYLAPHTTLASDVKTQAPQPVTIGYHAGVERLEKAVWQLGQDLSHIHAVHMRAQVQPSATGTGLSDPAPTAVSAPAAATAPYAAVPDPTHPYGGSAS